MSVVVVTEPAKEPVTLAEAKDHLRVTASDDDPYIIGLIKSARLEAETFTGRALITTTFDWFLDDFIMWTLEVPRPPLQSVTSIKYIDTNGDQQTWAASNYDVDTNKEPGRIEPANNVSYPSLRHDLNAVEIRFVAGYGTDETDVPERIRQGMLVSIANQYEHRQAFMMGSSITKISGMSPEDYWWPYRRWIRES